MTIYKAGGSDSPVPYSLTPDGIQLNDGDTFEANGHIDIKFTSDDGSSAEAGIHFDPNNDHPGGQWIGESFLPWSPFGLESGDCVTWIQISQYNEHYGEGGQEAYCIVGEEEPPVEEPEEPTPEEPEVPTVTKYEPSVEDTCDGTTWTHPAFEASYGEITHYEVSVNGGAREAYTPGDVILVAEDGGSWSVSLFAYSKTFPMGHQLGQSKGVDEVCEITPPVDPEEPEEPEEPETPDPEEPEEPEEPEDETSDSETVTSSVQPVTVDDQLAVTGSGFDIAGILVAGALLAAGASLLVRKKIAR